MSEFSEAVASLVSSEWLSMKSITSHLSYSYANPNSLQQNVYAQLAKLARWGYVEK